MGYDVVMVIVEAADGDLDIPEASDVQTIRSDVPYEEARDLVDRVTQQEG